MTYAVALNLERGMVFAADTRTIADPNDGEINGSLVLPMAQLLAVETRLPFQDLGERIVGVLVERRVVAGVLVTAVHIVGHEVD